ncbi:MULTISPECIES: HAD domain-containing protein [Paenibacillus]|uniref:HAD domain-containing protein n=1 Tax=Paenibacillus violae TaxID=3077234 RepID=A0ABU3RJU5_9BACL|nr:MULTISPECIES: HAD domain-containing protein [Paenibacillus]MDU0204361.1 HAD domain-containing protein [Paenibacillus sp. PFR10]MEC0269953.1 HAD domain-containing protein [Paenibacillus anseongense]
MIYSPRTHDFCYRDQFFCLKVIFLNIDGVLVTTNSLTPSGKYFGHTFDKTCVQNLIEILNATGAKNIISSSWREGRTLVQLQSIFKANGLEDCVIDVRNHSYNKKWFLLLYILLSRQS